MSEPYLPSPQNCFEELRPLCDEVLHMIETSPLTVKERAGLSTLVAMHFFGAAIGDQQRALPSSRPSSALARELLEMIVDGIARGERLRVVPTPPRGGHE